MLGIRAVLTAALALLLASSAGAGVIYDNLGPSKTFVIDDGYVIGPFNTNDWWTGFQFTANGAGVVASIDVAVSVWTGGSPVPMTFQLYTDTGGTVGVLLEEITVTATGVFPLLGASVESGVASGSTGIMAGTPYWLMATASSSSVWHYNAMGDSLPRAHSSNGSGSALMYAPPFTAGAFRINSVPEPSTLLIMGGALIGLGFMRRNRRL